MPSSSRTTLLLDANNAMWRAFYVLSGPLGAAYGFLKQLRYQLDKFEVNHCCVCWDGKGATKARKKIYPQYKDGRDKPDFDYKSFYDQYPLVKKLLKLLGVVQVEHPEMEADDCIAYLAKKRRRGEEIVIISTDKDMLPLVSPGVRIYQPVKDNLVTKDNFVEQFQMTPFQYFQYRVLSGDSSDNLRGVLGGKGALWVIQTFGSLETFFSALEQSVEEPSSKPLGDVDRKLRYKKFVSILTDEKLDIIERNLDLMSPKLLKPSFERGRLQEERLKRIFLKAGWKSFLFMNQLFHPFRRLETA